METTIFERHIKTLKNSPVIYNGKTLECIFNNLPNNMIGSHKDEYINNCIEVWRAENSGYKAESLRFRNFILVNYYL